MTYSNKTYVAFDGDKDILEIPRFSGHRGYAATAAG